jgi:hypothetical protein
METNQRYRYHTCRCDMTMAELRRQIWQDRFGMQRASLRSSGVQGDASLVVSKLRVFRQGDHRIMRQALLQWHRGIQMWSRQLYAMEHCVCVKHLREMAGFYGNADMLKYQTARLLDQWQRISTTRRMWQRRSRLRMAVGLRNTLPESLVRRIWAFLTEFDAEEWEIASNRKAWMRDWRPWFAVLECAELDQCMVVPFTFFWPITIDV